jgi:hypothetical protein
MNIPQIVCEGVGGIPLLRYVVSRRPPVATVIDFPLLEMEYLDLLSNYKPLKRDILLIS